MDPEHPALVAARSSWRCVQARDKQAWLDLMADDICMEDPIGKAPTNPSGEGLTGKDAVAELFDTHMAKSTIEITTHESFAAGNESAHRMTLRTTFENGVTTQVDGIFTYRVDDAGRLTNLRGYWAVEDMQVTRSSD